MHHLLSSLPLPLAVSESTGEEHTCLARFWVPGSPSSAPPWGLPPTQTQGSGQLLWSSTCLQGGPGSPHCRHGTTPGSEAERGEAKGVLQALQTFCTSVSQPARGSAGMHQLSLQPVKSVGEDWGIPPLTAASNPSSASVQKAAVSSRSCLGRVCRKNVSVPDVLFPHSGRGSQNQMEPVP